MVFIGVMRFSVCLSVFTRYLKSDGARITKLDIENMFHAP